MSDPNTVDSLEPIAIIGIAGRFPGSQDVNEFWHNLCERRDSISSFSDEEIERAGVDRATLSSPNYVKAGGVIEGVDLFDASFFGLTPREAEVMDPQQRIFLECAWNALENAGYDPETYQGRIGVYAGSAINGYLLNIHSNSHLLETISTFQTVIGNEKDHLSTLVSYKLNLKGPSVAIQTTCSTSLVAVSMACQSLLCYQSDMALAGGISIRVPQKSGYVYTEGGIGAPDGRCRAFDAKAQGIVSGDGVGIVVLKRLTDALADGDCISAVIRSFAINNDGSGKVGYTAPSVDGQAEVIAEALAMARINPETVTYLEAHGTGTTLGDPIEVAALTQAFRTTTRKKGFCALGSVKTNIGHLNTAAGVAGLIKTTLALKHKLLPPSLHFEQPNPKIDFASSPFFVNTELTSWVTNDVSRRAGVSSFGIGGTNAHVILEEAPPQAPSGKGRPNQLLVLSATTESALAAATTNLAEYLKRHAEINLADVAYTLQVGRRSFDCRRMLVCQNVSDAVLALEAPDSTKNVAQRERPIVMMFSGQGAQYVNMARGLYQHEKVFREQIDLCSEILLPHLKLDLRDAIYPREEHIEVYASILSSTAIAQPALFVIEYALAQLWISWGVCPEAMIGHSIGEYVAACLAEVMSLEDALALIATRGRLMQQLPGGRMLAVALPERDVRSLLDSDRRLSLAAVNSPSLCVVSGPADAVNHLTTLCDEKGTSTRILHTSHAFHSEMMEPALAEFLNHVQKLKLRSPKIPYISNLTGTWITDAQATDPTYWTKHLRHTVRFSEGVTELLKNPGRIFLEVGPGHTLSTSIRQARGHSADTIVLSTLPHPQDKASDTRFILATLGNLWLAGINVDWNGFNVEKRRRIPLPTYPFERQRYWIDRVRNAAEKQSEPTCKKPGLADWFYASVWTQSPEIKLQPPTRPSEKLSTLILTDDCGLGVELAKQYRELEHDVVTVAIGDDFVKFNDGMYVINPRRRADYEQLFRELQSHRRLPQKIIHLWTITPDVEDARAAMEFSEQYQMHGFYSLLLLTQTLVEQDSARQFDIEIVTNNVHDVTGDEILCPQKATILGACKAIPWEVSNVSCRIIDVVLPKTQNQAMSRLVKQLSAEFTRDSSDTVAYRGNHRWVRRFEPMRFDSQPQRDTPLRERGVYLITGGLSGIGLALAEHLSHTTRAKLILTEESNFPRRDDWDSWLAAHGEQHEVSQKIQKVRALERMGGEVLISTGPFKPEGLRAAIKEARERFGEINGVLHTEACCSPELIRSNSIDIAAEKLIMKVQETLLLETELKDVKLDFLTLFSSANSITGALAQVDDCATSAFLDAFAHYNSSVNGRPTIAIDWDMPQWEGWLDQPRNIKRELENQLREVQERDGISLPDAVAAFERLLSGQLTQVVVSRRNFAPFPPAQNSLSRAQLSEELRAHSVKSDHSGIKSKSSYVAPGNQVERTIADVWQEVLGIKRVGIHDNFFDLGGNSLLGIQLMSMLRRAFLLELPMNSLFEAPTVAEQAIVISETQRKEHELEELEQMLKEIEGLSAEDLEAKLVLIEQLSSEEVK
jgi:acyl transferase domain-containing protein/acyl carrier protein